MANNEFSYPGQSYEHDAPKSVQGLRPMEQITTPVYTHEQAKRAALGILDYAAAGAHDTPAGKALAIYEAAKALVEALK